MKQDSQVIQHKVGRTGCPCRRHQQERTSAQRSKRRCCLSDFCRHCLQLQASRCLAGSGKPFTAGRKAQDILQTGDIGQDLRLVPEIRDCAEQKRQQQTQDACRNIHKHKCDAGKGKQNRGKVSQRPSSRRVL